MVERCRDSAVHVTVHIGEGLYPFAGDMVHGDQFLMVLEDEPEGNQDNSAADHILIDSEVVKNVVVLVNKLHFAALLACPVEQNIDAVFDDHMDVYNLGLLVGTDQILQH